MRRRQFVGRAPNSRGQVSHPRAILSCCSSPPLLCFLRINVFFDVFKIVGIRTTTGLTVTLRAKSPPPSTPWTHGSKFLRRLGARP